MSNPIVRAATTADAAALLDIYRPFVVETAVSFELAPPSVEEFAARIDTALRSYAWLVAEVDGRPIGYAYATSHRAREAYQWSVETSVYIDRTYRGQGVGKQLYVGLIPALLARGFCNAYAGATLPNDASLALHRAVGFTTIGVFPSVGYKFGQWHDVIWWHLRLRTGPPGDARSRPRT